MNRRKFVLNTALTSIGGLLGINYLKGNNSLEAHLKSSVNGGIMLDNPTIISTWRFGIAANDAAYEVLSKGGNALDAVEAGVKVPEADLNNTSVGRAGYPDRDGKVTLDACIMDKDGNAGSVAFIQHIAHPISVARAVMEKTPHVMLVGDGALQFALENGFKKEELLTENAKKAWEEWKKKNNYTPPIGPNNHDTIGMLAIDKEGNISGACTTSGLAFKMHGRVGDSPIIGAGMYADNNVGGAAATGLGEAVIKVAGSFLVVEAMRNGRTPQEACEMAVHRIVEKQKNYKDIQVGFIALNKHGERGAYSIVKGFQYAFHQKGENKVYDSDYHLKE